MALTLVQFRIGEQEKLKSNQILEKLGLTLPEYLRMCMYRLTQENGIPFSISTEKENIPGSGALQRTSRVAEAYGIDDMLPDEINAEIGEARKSNLTDSLTGILHENNIIEYVKEERIRKKYEVII